MATARCILVIRGRVLILRRTRRTDGKHLTLHFCFPGGVIENDEDPWSCARREMLEETGFRVTRDQYLGHDEAADVYYFLVELEPGQDPEKVDLSGSDEHDRFRWMSPSDIVLLMELPSMVAAMARANLDPPELPWPLPPFTD